ncbi:G patch domain and ankyrin repeat-containing protein 1 isoform X1 [Struthio camelus]|uniref:G patch domain and ankyrin repeat-containing protein 1 isoform X1 n=1 Tax=Struthio camelus TaxID=8801 RepID=UPI003603E8C7
MAQLIAFTRARDETDCWKDGHLQRRPAAPAEPGSQAGDEARRFYESLLAGEDGAGPAAPPVPPAAPPATPSEPPVPPAEPPPAPSEPPRARRKPPAAPSGPTDTRRGNALLKAAQDGDLGTLRRLLEKEGCDVNYRDGFAWTALMCAARAGRAAAVRYLLRRGAARTGFREAGGRDAAGLAEDAGHRGLARLLREWRPEPEEAPRPAPAERRFCGVCGTHYAEESAAQHERSTAHLLSRGDPPPPARYHIPETNVGFRLLVKGGWDGRAGLGPAGDGRRFPVQTLLKRDHRGLGCPSDLRPRVTHFEARDAAAVAEPPKPRAERAGAAGKRQAQRREAAARAWERDLRAYMGR